VGDEHARCIRVARREPRLSTLEDDGIAELRRVRYEVPLRLWKSRLGRGEIELAAELPKLTLARESTLQTVGLGRHSEVFRQPLLMIPDRDRGPVVHGEQYCAGMPPAETEQSLDPVLVRTRERELQTPAVIPRPRCRLSPVESRAVDRNA
jgi:hypothetical protein